MGSFGYMCPVCETSIRGNFGEGGELCILIHKRHGEEIGRTEGHYNEYGGVVEDKYFRSDEETDASGKQNRNTHSYICQSEIEMPDSNAFGKVHFLPDGERFDASFASYGTDGFFKMDRRFESFRAGYTDALREQVARLEKGKKLFYKNCGNEQSLTKEEQEMIIAYLKFDHKTAPELSQYLIDWIRNLPKLVPASGTTAVHKKCYDSLSEEEQKALPISKHDPDQSWGGVREEYR